MLLKSDPLPVVVRRYQNHMLDSTLWDAYHPRPDDIVISTSYKSGTTWMQGIVGQLIFGEQEVPPGSSPWLDARWTDQAEKLALLEAQTHRRYIKTHLALDGLPYYPEVRYIVVNRDARDVFMSFWNHYSSFTPAFYDKVNNLPGRVGPPLPPCPEDIHECWRNWITRGWFEWESEGYPWWGNLHHTKSWWEYRHLPNLLFVYYNDLQTDLTGEIRRVADFLSIPVSDAEITGVAEKVSLAAMRRKAEALEGLNENFRGGATTFFYKGSNGRWKGVLSDDELALYHEAAERLLPADCIRWLEHGRAARPSPSV